MNNQLIKLKVAVLSIMVLLGGCYVQENPPPNPKASPEKALDSYVKLGLEYISLGNTQLAKAPLTRALELNSRSPEANAALAYMYQKDAEPALAETYFKKALEYNKKYTTGRNNYGMFLYSQGRYDEALTQLKIASEDTLYGRRAAIFNNIGLVYVKLKNTAEAQAAFNKSTILNGNNPDAYYELAEMNFDNKAYEQASSAYENYKKLLPQQEARGLWLGIRLARALGKKTDEAMYAAQLKQAYPASNQYLLYRTSLESR